MNYELEKAALVAWYEEIIRAKNLEIARLTTELDNAHLLAVGGVDYVVSEVNKEVDGLGYNAAISRIRAVRKITTRNLSWCKDFVEEHWGLK